MSFRKQALTATALAALAVAISSPALAAGTAAGTSVANTASIAYDVGGAAMTAITSSDTVVIDRVVRMTMAGDAGTTTVTPGATAAVTKFTLNNTSNETLDFVLSATQPTSGTGPNGGTDTFDVTGGKFYADSNTNGAYNAGTDLEATYLDEVLADTTRTFFYVANIPNTAANKGVAVVGAIATAAEGGVLSTQGAVVTATAGANTAAKDTVFGDIAGTDDAATDGKISARDDYTAASAQITVSRTATPISNLVEGTTNPKLIPSAVVEYCVIVSNAAGAVTAADLAIGDVVNANLTFDTAWGVYQGGTATGGVCATDATNGGTKAGTYTAGTSTVNGTIASLAAGESKTVRYRAKVN